MQRALKARYFGLGRWRLINSGGLTMELQERLNEIFREVIDEDDIKIAPEMTSDDIDGWDSLSHVNLITANDL
jgi:hypothetical protein